MASKFTAPDAKKTVVKPAKVITPTTKVELPEPEPTTAEQEVHSAWRQVEDAVRGLAAKIKRPSWVRELVSVTLGLVTYAAVVYGAMQLVDIVVLAAVTYTGVGFISFLITFLGVLAAFMAAFTLGKLAYSVAAKFEFSSVKQRALSMFSFARPAAA